MMVPGPAELSAAWAGLAPSLRDRIGFIALDMVFQGFLSGDAYAEEDKVLADREARGEADERSSANLSELYRVIEGALPDLFGQDGENPAWARRSG
jgi:hypothetical protein